MHPYVKQEWVKALRSGEYTQGRDELRTTIGANKWAFCCLGVLCDLDAKQRGIPFCEAADPKNTYYLTQEASARLGVPENCQRKLAMLNDEGVPFREIAKWIKDNL